LDTIENNIRAVGVCEVDVDNRNKLRFRTKMADPKSWEEGEEDEEER